MISIFRSLFAPPRHLILLLVAFWLGLALIEKRAERHGISRDALTNLVYYCLLGYIAGGRLIYALSNLGAFSQSPPSIFSLNLDLFDPWAALVVAVIVGLVYGSRQKLPLLPTLDALTPFFAAVMIGLSLSHLAAGTAFGRPTDIPWGIELWNATRHPTQIYALIASLLVFGLIWFRKADAQVGSTFLLFSALTAGTHLFLEAFHGDSILIFGGVRMTQVIAWIVLAIALFLGEFIPGRQKVA
jgi:phosphatidylglycerol:prolipoprotein diacylglycerol transferase